MAKMAVDRIVEREGREAACRTDEIPLGLPASDEDLMAVDGVDEETHALFAHRYGHAAREVLELAASDERLARRIVPELPDLVGEAPFAARNEQAASVADVLLRRTRLGILDARPLSAPDGEAARAVAEAMAPELGWDAARVDQELRDWREVAREEGIALGAPAPAP
jgi:glycerol-3-phosphate dehydrogenase